MIILVTFGSSGWITSVCKISESTISGCITLGSNVSTNSGWEVSTVSNSLISKDVTSGSVLIGSDDAGWLISNVVLDGVASKVAGLVVCVFLFLWRPCVSFGGKGDNLFILREWRGCSSTINWLKKRHN